MIGFWGGFEKKAKLLGSMPNLFKGTKSMMSQPKIKQMKIPTVPKSKPLPGMKL